MWGVTVKVGWPGKVHLERQRFAHQTLLLVLKRTFSILAFTILRANYSQFKVSGFSSGNIFAPSQNQCCLDSSLLFVALGHEARIFYQWLCHSPFSQLIHDSIIGSLAHHINLWINGSEKAEDPEAVAGMRLRKLR